MTNGKYERSKGINLPNNEEITEINRRKGQKHLEELKVERVEDRTMKEKIRKNTCEESES